MSKDSILIVGGGLLQIPAVEAAHSLGLRAIVTDRNPDAPAMLIADEAHIVDIYDSPNHVALGMKLKDRLAGVFTEGADVEVTVASVAAALGLPGISVEAAKRCKNKAWMRQMFEEADISPIKWRETTNLYNAFDFKADSNLGWPIVIKATDNCASRGVHVVHDAAEFSTGFFDAVANGTTGTVLVEEYLEGHQQSVEILFASGGKVHWLNIVDRYFDGPIELGHVNPSNLPDEKKAALYMMTEAAAGAVGVSFGAFKADTIWTEKGPRILEATARLSGGFDCQYTTPMATGRNFIRAAMKLAIGRDDIDEDLQPKHERWAAAWGAFPKPGWVKSIHYLGPDDSIHGIFRAEVGDIIEPYTNSAQRPAFVIATGDTYYEAMTRAKTGAAALAERIMTE